MSNLRATRMQPTPIPLSSRSYMSVVRIRQYVSYWPLRLFSRIVLRGRIRILLQPEDIKLGFRYVMASNHQSGLDPFVTCTALPLSLWSKLGTFRFFTRTDLFTHTFLRTMLTWHGSFAAKAYKDLPYGVEAARAYLGRGQTVMIFPEGRRSTPGSSTARHGVEQLELDPLVRIIPIHIQWHKHWSRSFQLTVGRPMAPNQSAEAILEACYALELPR